MPNLKQHVSIGAIVGGGLNLAWQLHKLYDSPESPHGFWEVVNRLDFLELAAFAAIGVLCAALPDMLEPATNPNHRALLHSVCCGGAVTYGAFGTHTEKWRPEDRMTVRTAALSYLSHLALDSGTPKGLPVI